MTHKLLRKTLRTIAHYDPDYYDMHDDPNEAFFAQYYVERIVRHAEGAGIRPPATVLEAGCQAGRLVVPFAKRGFRVTGIDTSSFALRRAKQHARQAGVEVAFVQGNLTEVIPHQLQQYDLVICAEVVYLSSAHRAMLQVLVSAVKPGGLLCVSHRSSAYYLVEALRHRDFEAARIVLSGSEGRFPGPFPEAGCYNWQTEDELRALYKELGLARITLYPIDRFAWLTGTSPSDLTDEERQALLAIESEATEPPATCARYVLVIASKPTEDQT
jgi:SAM-dependent methyltransferase